MNMNTKMNTKSSREIPNPLAGAARMPPRELMRALRGQKYYKTRKVSPAMSFVIRINLKILFYHEYKFSQTIGLLA